MFHFKRFYAWIIKKEFLGNALLPQTLLNFFYLMLLGTTTIMSLSLNFKSLSHTFKFKHNESLSSVKNRYHWCEIHISSWIAANKIFVWPIFIKLNITWWNQHFLSTKLQVILSYIITTHMSSNWHKFMTKTYYKIFSS